MKRANFIPRKLVASGMRDCNWVRDEVRAAENRFVAINHAILFEIYAKLNNI